MGRWYEASEKKPEIQSCGISTLLMAQLTDGEVKAVVYHEKKGWNGDDVLRWKYVGTVGSNLFRSYDLIDDERLEFELQHLEKQEETDETRIVKKTLRSLIDWGHL